MNNIDIWLQHIGQPLML